MGLNHIHKIIILVFSIPLIEPSTPSGMPDAPITEIVPSDELEVSGLSNGSTVEVKLGDRVFLLCSVKNGVPATKLTWLRNGVEITKDSTAGLGATSTSIKINATFYGNGAMYSCVGKHPALNRPLRTNIILSVISPPGPPEIEGYIEGDIVKEGDNLTLACISRRGNPPARLVWLRNDVLVNTTYSTVRGETTNNYTFTVGPEDNNAVYKCEASRLTVHNFSKSVRLNVMFPPEAPEIEGYIEGEIVKEGDQRKLLCISRSGNPPARIIWLRNDVVDFTYSAARGKTSNSLWLTFGPEDNNAVYKCEASNTLTVYPSSKSVRLNVMFIFFNASSSENSQQYVPCKPGWYFFGEKCYKILPVGSDTGLNWANSIDLCTLDGGHLASIHSKELQEFLTTFLLLNSKSNAWIGLHDRVSESEFTWVDGSIYDYKNWDNNEPSRRYNRNEEDCVEMRYTNFKDGIGMWNDESCSSLRPHICQVDKNDDTKSPDPRFCSIEDGGGFKYLNSCYHIVKEEKSWEDAEKYCEEKYKGYLVSILEDNAEVFLNYIMKLSNVSKNVWIGIKMGNYSMQKWTSGWHVANKKFNQDRLHFANGTCAVKTNWNTWGIAPCLNKFPFICEKIKYNIPVLQRPPSDDWECPYTGKNWLDLGGDSCYYIENESSRNWLEANYECGRKGGTLASFHSENETNILHPHVLETQDRLLIGLKRSSTNRNVFEWADGTKVIYENWHKGEPNSKDEICGELWTESMKWNDLPCNIAKGYICKTQKRFSRSKFKDFSDQVPCKSALSKDQTYSSGVPVVTVVGIVFCTILVSLMVSVIVYHYRDCLKIYCTKTEKDGYTTPGSLGPVSDKVIWKPQGEELHY